jgi:hypothetical protein
MGKQLDIEMNGIKKSLYEYETLEITSIPTQAKLLSFKSEDLLDFCLIELFSA